MRGVLVSLLLLLPLTLLRAEPVRDRGSAIYTAYCAGCHGEHGGAQGEFSSWFDPPPARLADRELLQSLGKEGFIKIVRLGGRHVGKSPAMPSYRGRIDARQAEELWDFVNELALAEELALEALEGEGLCVDPRRYPRDEQGTAVQVRCELPLEVALRLLQEPSPHLGYLEPVPGAPERVVTMLGGPPGGDWLAALDLPEGACSEPQPVRDCQVQE